MDNLGQPNIDLSKLMSTHAVRQRDGSTVDAKKLMMNVSMISMKLNSDNVDYVRYLTTEGLSKKQRLQYLQQVQTELGSDLFELSTCNRVLYVGFGVSCADLEASVLTTVGMKQASFEHHKGMDVWRHLVKVCSGLDSFIIGELQVMSQFRGSVAWHRKHGLVGEGNGHFFDHIVAANRVLRRKLGFTQTTESMLNLATTSLEELIEESPDNTSAILGFGEMGCKAVETLIALGQTDITVISRSPDKALARNPDIARKVNLLSFEEWDSSNHQPNIIISTIRNIEPMYNAANPIPSSDDATIMDFSWPPSVEPNAILHNQRLMGMEYWINAAHKYSKQVDYSSIIERSDELLFDIENKFMTALTDRTQAKFRAFVYQTLEGLSQQWEQSEHVDESVAEMGAFSREIATWICNQDGPFATADLDAMVLTTSRPINPILLKRVANDVIETITRINEKSTLSEVTS